MKLARLSLPIVLGLALAACGGSPVRPQIPGQVNLERQRHAMEITEWSFSGRVALSDGKDGGSGSLDWQQDDAVTKLQFRAALGRGAWQLDAAPGTAVLKTGKGEVYSSDDAGALVSEHIGWQVPMAALPYWVLGLATPGYGADLETDEWGLPEQLSQLGWEISYNRWNHDYQLSLPVRITARKGNYSFKLVVRDWHLPGSD